LTASYLTDAQLSPSETEKGECQGEGAVRLAEAPLLRWQDPKNVSVPDLRYRLGEDVVLASVWIQGCKIAKAISAADRRDLHASTQPYITGGSTAAGHTAWTAWSPAGAMAGVTVTVDTSSAGFITTPTYTAQVNGTRFLAAGIVIDGPVSVSDFTPTSFTVTVALPRDLPMGAYVMNPSSIISPWLVAKVRAPTALGWYVSWTGIEG
jgi:hypothetical protein